MKEKGHCYLVYRKQQKKPKKNLAGDASCLKARVSQRIQFLELKGKRSIYWI